MFEQCFCHGPVYRTTFFFHSKSIEIQSDQVVQQQLEERKKFHRHTKSNQEIFHLFASRTIRIYVYFMCTDMLESSESICIHFLFLCTVLSGWVILFIRTIDQQTFFLYLIVCKFFFRREKKKQHRARENANWIFCLCGSHYHWHRKIIFLSFLLLSLPIIISSSDNRHEQHREQIFCKYIYLVYRNTLSNGDGRCVKICTFFCIKYFNNDDKKGAKKLSINFSINGNRIEWMNYGPLN